MTKHIGKGVIEALKAGTIEGNVFKFAAQVERPLYLAVSSVLKDHGGKWSKEAAGIQFEQDPSTVIADIIAAGPTKELPTVIIEIRNGVAKVIDHPKGLRVDIRYIDL